VRLRKSSLEVRAIIAAIAQFHRGEPAAEQVLRLAGAVATTTYAAATRGSSLGRAMTDATLYLTSLAQALAKMSLYAEGHPSRARAADASFARLRTLQQVDATPTFSFLGREVIYYERTLRDLADWDWAQRFSSAGVQRIEFEAAVDRESYQPSSRSCSRVGARPGDARQAARHHASPRGADPLRGRGGAR
jgi:hypothetical protein